MRNGHYVIDTHCHVYPQRIARRAADNISDFYDGRPHVSGDTDTLLGLMEQTGTDYAVINSAAMSPGQVEPVNSFLLATALAHPDKLTPVGTVHPGCSGPQMEQAFHFLCDNGFHGVKIHSDMLRIAMDDPVMNRVYAGCREAGLPVLLHTGDYRFDFSNPSQLVGVLERFPDLQVIGTHMGGWSVYAEAMERLPEYPNIVVDCSSSFCDLTMEETMAIFRAFGPERILFGTDFPIVVPGFDMDYFLRLPLTEAEQEGILWRNAVKAYNLTPPWMQ